MRIKNWSRFQHYKSRKPPWIKLYRDILDDVEWNRLSGDASKTLVMLWVIASEADGDLPTIEKIAFRLRKSEKDVNNSLSELSHWIDGIASNTLASRKQLATLETERETETYKEEKRTDTGLVAKKTATPSPQASFVQTFKESYEAMTGQPFNSTKAHFIIAARLIKTHGLEAVVLKAKTLGALCRDRSVWFTMGGWADFSIEKLSNRWNEIIPDVVPLSKEDKEKREDEAIRAKVREANERTKRALDN